MSIKTIILINRYLAIHNFQSQLQVKELSYMLVNCITTHSVSCLYFKYCVSSSICLF